jgi:hypothetical protein
MGPSARLLASSRTTLSSQPVSIGLLYGCNQIPNNPISVFHTAGQIHQAKEEKKLYRGIICTINECIEQLLLARLYFVNQDAFHNSKLFLGQQVSFKP